MAESKVAGIRTTYYVSSSIENFREKLDKKLGLSVWHWWKNCKDNVIFFGMYHKNDYRRLLWQLLWGGKVKIFWCGGDIINLYKNRKYSFRISTNRIKHYCENNSEIKYLEAMGIEAEIRPLLFGDIPELSFVPSDHPHLYMNCHKGRELEYDVPALFNFALQLKDFTFHIYGIEKFLDFSLKNVIFHGQVSEQQFNNETAKFQGALRFNIFDGFSEVLAKAVLRGQYCYSYISYPHMETIKAESPSNSIPYISCKNVEELKFKNQPNIQGREYWLKQLTDNQNEIVHNWLW